MLTVGVILQPKRAYSLLVVGRLLTMRSISSPPLVGPRLGLTRDNIGPSATCSLIGAADVCKRPRWPADSDSSWAWGIGADTSAVGLCTDEDRGCTRPERWSSPADVPEELPLCVRGLERSPEVQSEHQM